MSQPTRSSPIIVDEQRRRVWVFNPDNDSVAVIDADNLILLQEIEVCAQPTGLALDSRGQVWTTCRNEDGVRVLDVDDGTLVGTLTLAYGAQPFSIVFTPDGLTGYIAEYGPGRITRVDAAALTVTGSLNIGPTPRALAISADGQIWDLTHLGEGLRNTPDLRGRRGMGHGNVHWTANFDEIQDFELPIRLFFEGSGFMSDDDLFSGTRLSPFGDPKAGFSAELDALAAYAATFKAVPRSPYRAADGSLTVAGTAGRVVFQDLGCRQCHAGPDLTDTTLHDVGTFKAGSGKRLDQTLTGIETPTLKGIWATAPYRHDGSAPTLADVFEQGDPDSPHGIVRSLNGTDRANLIAYLLQIDENVCQHSTVRPPPPANLSYTVYLPVILSANNNCP